MRKHRSKKGRSLVAAFALACGTALNSCTNIHSGFRSYTLITDQQRQENGYWTISIASDRLRHFPLINDPVHNFIIIRDEKGKKVTTFHGLGVDRETCRMVGMGNNNHAIYGVVENNIAGYAPQEIFVETQIYFAAPEDVVRKCTVMIDAMHCINQQNLPYDLVEFFGRGQNSNSVAYTLVRAAGLDFPEENLREWEEGHGRLLLPEGWRSYYEEDWQPPEDGLRCAFWTMTVLSEELDKTTREIAANGPPPKERRKFFDPAEPFVAYEPLMIDNIDTAWAQFKEECKEKKEQPEPTPAPN